MEDTMRKRRCPSRMSQETIISTSIGHEETKVPPLSARRRRTLSLMLSLEGAKSPLVRGGERDLPRIKYATSLRRRGAVRHGLLKGLWKNYLAALGRLPGGKLHPLITAR